MEQKSATNGGSDRAANIGSRKRARAFPKGRQIEGDALREVRELLGSRPRRPDLLIEFLHLIQDRYHHLSARHLRALCEEMRLPQASVYEVATFYSHFDVVKEGETPPPPTTIRVCDSITCELKGAEALLDALEAHADPAKVRVLRAACMTRRAEVLDLLEPGPTASLNPVTLARYGVAPGQSIKVTTRRGSIELTARADRAIQDGTIFIPFAYVEAAANVLTNPQLDPIAKIPEYKYCAVRIEPGHGHERPTVEFSQNVTASGL